MNAALEFINRNWREMLTLTLEHLTLVLITILCAVAIGIPAGILLTRRAALKRPVLGLANILQTVPSLALFGFLIPLPFVGGIGARTAIIALVLYALLPVIRNTVTGIEGVDRNVREAALAMGMTSRQILWQVELPLAASVILAGVRVATVISVGVATIAAAIGAGGLGMYIFRGLRMNDNLLILAGALPAALMALAADFGLGLLEGKLNVRSRRPEKKRFLFIPTWAVFLIIGVALFGSYVAWRSSAFSDREAGISRLVVGSKDFTEQVILGELLAQTLEAEGIQVERRFELGGNLCHDALLAGQIDLYPEYTGTAFTAILRHEPISDADEVYERVRREYEERFDVAVSEPLGFSNDFAILVRGDDARRLGLSKISDIASLAENWRAGFGQDFMSRPDGFKGWAKTYNLKFRRQPREMDLSLTYRALASQEVDIIAGNSTDGLIAALDLAQLYDDRHFFPPYQAVVMTRRNALARQSKAEVALARLARAISTEEMRRLNYEVDGKKRGVADVVREWRASRRK